jgi:hypothetical protein
MRRNGRPLLAAVALVVATRVAASPDPATAMAGDAQQMRRLAAPPPGDWRVMLLATSEVRGWHEPCG